MLIEDSSLIATVGLRRICLFVLNVASMSRILEDTWGEIDARSRANAPLLCQYQGALMND